MLAKTGHAGHLLPLVLLTAFLMLAPPAPAQTPAWTRLSPQDSPTVREGHAMVYDSVRQRVLLFGGWTHGRSISDTWEWDGRNWTWRFPTTSPPPIGGSAMAYDGSRQRVILVLGSGTSAQTWEWDSADWTRRTPSTTPGGGAMAYDQTRQQTVLFGGSSRNETWEWDGNSWARRTPATSPTVRSSHAMAYDQARQRVVLFGGSVSSVGPSNDTWEWDGTNWAQRAPLTSPPARTDHAMAYDPSRQRVVLFGGGQVWPDSFHDTWDWDGTNWTRRTPVAAPPPRRLSAMASDPSGAGVFLFGGNTLGGPIADSWHFSGDLRTGHYTVFGDGCRGTAGLPSLQAGQVPRIGRAFSLVLTQLPANSVGGVFWGFNRDLWSFVPLPLDLAPLGLPGCRLYTDVVLSFAPVETGPFGVAVWGTTLANEPAHVGVQFFNQAWFVDPGANPGGLVLTNAGAGIIGQ